MILIPDKYLPCFCSEEFVYLLYDHVSLQNALTERYGGGMTCMGPQKRDRLIEDIVACDQADRLAFEGGEEGGSPFVVLVSPVECRAPTTGIHE